MRVLGRAAAVAVSRGVNPTEPHRLSLAAATCCESLAFPNRSGALPATPSGRPVQLYLAQGGAGWLRSRRSLIPAVERIERWWRPTAGGAREPRLPNTTA